MNFRSSTLFPDEDIRCIAPRTESIKYIGSKLRIVPHILRLASKVKATTVFDGFSGTTRVSQAFAKQGYSVICNDVAIWSSVLGTAYLLNKKPREEYQPLINHLNHLPPIDGWFSETYGGYPNRGSSVQKDGLKRPWQMHNTRKLDAIRREIESLRLNRIEKAVALTSLLLALDRVDNSLGHFASYLREWSPRSYRPLLLQVPHLFSSGGDHSVLMKDIFYCLEHLDEVDLAYLDPPYGSNNERMPPSRVRYASYYHLWKTVCLFDNPNVFGKARRRTDTSDKLASSVFEDFRRGEDGRFIVVEAIERMIRAVKARWIILSYSSGGRATAEQLSEILQENGDVIEVQKVDYKRNVMGSMTWTNEWVTDASQPHQEFLFLMEK